MTPFDGEQPEDPEQPDSFTPAPPEFQALRPVDRSAETLEHEAVNWPEPVYYSPVQSQTAKPTAGPGRRLIAMIAVIALLFGAIGGGVAGGIAGYALGNGGSSSATATTAPSVAQQVSNEPATTTASSVSDLVARINPAVVTIENTLGGQFGQGGTATGSGFIIDQAGHIITNNHVIADATSLKVTFSDGSETEATLVGTNPFQDVAVIKVDVPVPATVSFGDSGSIRAGDPVLAIGSALGEFTNTVTNGIVSATDRSLDTGEGYRLGNLIQHNAPISPGNSGGPLVNLNGDVIGMNTAVVRGSQGASAEGLGFAVAGNTVKQIAETIIASGSAELPYIGISFADAATVNPSLSGVIVQDVASGSPAAQAGIRVGDLITAIDGANIDADHPFLNLMLAHKPGDVVTLAVTHENGQETTITVTLGTRPA